MRPRGCPHIVVLAQAIRKTLVFQNMTVNKEKLYGNGSL